MTQHPMPTEYPVQGDGWGIVVGRRGAGAADVAEVPLRSGVLEVDPMEPSPALVLSSPDHELIAELFGSAAAGEVALGATQVSAEPTDLLIGLCRLGELLWLRRCGALPLDRGLLDAEIAVAVAECEPVLDPDWEPDPSLAALTEQFVAASRRLRHGPGLPEEFRELIGRALAYIETAPNDPFHEAVRHERELIEAAELWPEARDWGRLDDELHRLRVPQAVHLGGDDAVRVDSLDWRRAPDQLLPADEDTVRYAVKRDGVAAGVSVSVADPIPGQAAPVLAGPAMPQPDVVARLYCPPLPIALAHGRLERGTAGGWYGELPLSRNAAELINGPLLLDVHRAGMLSPPLMGVHRLLAQATRWSARAVAWARLVEPGSADTVWDDVRFTARFAGRLWGRLARDQRTPDGGSQAAVRAERCARLASSGSIPAQLSVAERWFWDSR